MDSAKKYFNAEQAESLVFFGLGVVAMAIAVWFFFFKNDAMFRGMAWPLALVALIQLGVGYTIYTRSPKDLARVENTLQNDRSRIQSEEIPRMEKVMQSFVIIRWTEIALILAGLGLFFFMKDSAFWRGVGIGLAVQAALMLCADYFAEARGHVYLAELRRLI